MKIIIATTLTLLSFIQVVGQNAFTENQIKLLDSIATQDVPDDSAPGVATAMIRDGKVVYEKYAGLADLSDNTLI